MNESPIELDPCRLRAIQATACTFARGLSQQHGQRQFYTLAQVQSHAAMSSVDAATQPWLYAVFVTRDDFEACFALREVPGTYRQLRAALSPSERRSAPDEPPDVDFGNPWDWLEMAADY